MMKNAGWQGGGLGKTGDGMIAPIEVTMRSVCFNPLPLVSYIVFPLSFFFLLNFFASFPFYFLFFLFTLFHIYTFCEVISKLLD